MPGSNPGMAMQNWVDALERDFVVELFVEGSALP
jgi:hypothetical protein